jgi:DNA-binding cell septation regulator SpoVG
VKTVVVESIKPSPRSGATRAFVTFTISGLRVVDARIVEGSKGTFLAMPQKSWADRQGQTRYSSIVEVVDDDLKSQIQEQVLEQWRRQG